ncbi:MAG: ABC transporter substrate-binding protein [Rectinemataceae bacterium]|jgi:multiple sugar transport system substrate-binding protein
MKKGLIVAAAILLVAGISLGAQGEGKTREVKFWTLFTGGDGEFFDAMVQAFNASQNEIIMKTDTVKFTDYYTKLTTALAAKTAPDVVIVHQSQLINYVPNKVFIPLDAYLKKAGVDLSDFESKPLAACTFNGKIYAIPLDVHPLIMYYNKDLFAKAGITAVPQSLSDLVAAAKAIQDKTGAIGITADNTTATYKAYTLTRMFMSFLMQQDTPLLNASATKANFNNEAGFKALQALSDLVNKYGIIPKGLDYDSSVDDFKLGKAGIHFNGVWATGAFEEQAGLNFGSVQFPAVFGKYSSWADSHTFAVPVQKKQNEQTMLDVAKFINWMTSHGEMWAKAGHISTRKSVVAKAEFQNLLHRKDYAEAVKNVFAPPATAKWGEINDTVSDSLEAAVALNSDSRAALAQMEKKVNDILKK